MSSFVEITPELMAGFMDEAPEYLSTLDEGLLAFESKAGAGTISLTDEEDDKRMNDMFRAAHSLKGLSATMGFNDIRDLTHLTETLFDQLRMGKRALDATSVETLFGVFDTLRSLVAQLGEPSSEPITIEEALRSLESILASPGNDASAASLSVSPEVALRDAERARDMLKSASKMIDELNRSLPRLERDRCNAAALDELVGHARSIKTMMEEAGIDSLLHLTRDMEAALEGASTAEGPVEEALVSALFAAAVRLYMDVCSIRAGCLAEVTHRGTREIFARWVNGAAAEEEPEAGSGSESTVTGEARTSTEGDEDGDGRVVVVRVVFPRDFAEAAIQGCLIHKRLTEFGQVLACDPSMDEIAELESVEGLLIRVRTSCSADAIQDVVGTYSVERVEATYENRSGDGVTAVGKVKTSEVVDDTIASAPSPDKSPAGGAVPPATKAGETIRVDLNRLDQLMNLGGELVINRARFARIRTQLAPAFSGQNVKYAVDALSDRLARVNEDVAQLNASGGDSRILVGLSETARLMSQDLDTVSEAVGRVHECRGVVADFSEALHNLTRVSEGIQKGVMATRMVSIGPLFQRFRRVIRDMAKATGKDVELVLRGEHTELDKRMIDELADPITHMVRNSVDHGIEAPADRVAANKPATAQVVLNAYHRGRYICIEVRDDGKGVDIQRVKEKIIERELASTSQVEQMTDKEIAQFVFRPGFSTAKEVTDLSGRGMGMDIVVSKIDNVNGTVEIETTPGEGTVVTIKLPLTLAIITAVVARVGEGVYAIPLESVAEIIEIPRSRIRQVRRRDVINVRDRIIPVATFEHIFGTARPELQTVSRDDSQVTLVILSMQDEKMALVVDELICQEDVVIKSLTANYENVLGIAGASIMGDGGVSLILDVAAMMNLLVERNGDDAPPSADQSDSTGDGVMHPSNEPCMGSAA